MNYTEAMQEALSNEEFVSSYERLTGNKITTILESIKKGGINLEIDKATGHLSDELQKFSAFFMVTVWSRLNFGSK